MSSSFSQFELVTTKDVGDAVAEIKHAFDEKHKLEKQIANLIREYEDRTGFAIDMIKYQRDVTLPIRGSHYTALNIVITEQDIG